MNPHIPKEWAEWILKAEEVCVSEGLGPHNEDMLFYIFSTYPEFIPTYRWLMSVALEIKLGVKS